ncbi:large T antigen [Rousettus aegyptiacus polyomavirus 1]|uniref:DNA 3'-5' helicase n=1 Tax=Rousettus aegyptiacus polyomavirus 1 TaxID=1904411 RepID=A0A1S7J028_9POLY|nr:large T antigen [Rousettus aegyptiacus polyomavirus 1]BAX01893.1 large T antigen [Rousettus aegyptiacus polyomavirus 1]
MDTGLTREESQTLLQLLNLGPESYGNWGLMRKAFLSKCKELHPDKGGDPEKAKLLISLYKKLEANVTTLNPEESFSTSEPPRYGTPEWDQWWADFNDLFCHEHFPSDEEEPPSFQKRKSPSPEPSQATPPKKKKAAPPQDFPEDLQSFLSSAILSNKTVSCFCIYTTLEKSILLYKKLKEKYNATFVSRHKHSSNDYEGYLFMITPSRHRVSAILNYCRSLCSVSFVLVKGVNKEYPLYCHLCVEPFCRLEENIPGGLSRDFFDSPEEAQKNVSWKLISDFALEGNMDDIYLLMGIYKEFAESPEDCTKCKDKIIQLHYEHHPLHHENAQHFVECRNQKAICQQAVDGVIASKRVQNTQLSREQQLTERFRKLFHKMENLFSARSNVSMTLYMAGVAWMESLLPDFDMKELVLSILECFVNNVPKKRYYVFTGPVNTGKTTLAAALLDLCGGKSLNVNQPFDKLNFELGCAIDQFAVIFEDVKGQTSGAKHLPPGQGMCNLDHLRDYLDGAVMVNLEKKHLNKKAQIFPPGIITCNEYDIPVTLKARIHKIIKFKYVGNLFKSLQKTEDLGKYRVLQSGICLLLLLIYRCDVSDFTAPVQELVQKWKQRITEEVTDLQFLDFKTNILKGQRITGPTEGDPPTQECDTEDFVN